MKVKKIVIITGIIVLSLFLVLLIGLKTNVRLLKGLSASVNENGDSLWIECDKNSIDVNETTNCTIKGSSNKTVQSFQGFMEYDDSKLEVSEITKSSGFDGGSNNDVDLGYYGGNLTGTFTIATFKVKGLESGQFQIKLKDKNEDYKLCYIVESGEELSYSYFTETTYDITVNSGAPAASNDATLKSLKVNDQEVLGSQEFTLPNGTTTVNITAEANDSKATITGDIGEKTLNVGTNHFEIVVTAEDNNTVYTYTIDILREEPAAKSSINTLSSLKVKKSNSTSAEEIPIGFSTEVTSYNIGVENSVDIVYIEATPTSDKATVESGIGEKNLTVGENIINVVVKAENGDKKTYIVKIIREAKIEPEKSSDNTLKSLKITNVKISPEFSSDVTSYTSVVDSSVSRIKIEALANDSKATVTGDIGEKTLVNGINTFSITVKAENNKTKIYTITITKTKPSSNSTCSLKITSSVYNINENDSTISIPIDHKDGIIISNINSSATVTVNGDKVIVKCDNQTKEYKINRYWVAATGQNAVKYVVIITGLVVIIGVLFVLKNKKNK